ncbi:VOC family protein [Amycolatopsis cynarae]|uniref:VOC family protein n=1 Tax=Amycolatopsis cynarae TaxID=2995223 RepID=A0ABY7B1G4_9PSEU|nr:VOC family protein [Amycolatopsis sp. HUAS 11-8]WAL66146.1 VOC family protein [Amycolatopsis sp. HUAS 11-8]
MTTEGIEAVYLETHNWGKSARFFQALGYTLDFETDHNSGLLRNGSGPYLFIAEVPEEAPVGMQLVLRASKTSDDLDPVVEVVSPFERTHHGAVEMTVRDPDGRTWTVQVPAEG